MEEEWMQKEGLEGKEGEENASECRNINKNKTISKKNMTSPS